MRTIKILAPIHVMPNVTSVTTMVLHNIISELKKKVNVHVTWFVFSPDTPSSSSTDPDSTILSIHDYENALEVLKNEKPDLIYALPGWAFIDHAFSSAGQFLNIPVVGHITTGFHYHIHVNRLMLLKWFIKGFF